MNASINVTNAERKPAGFWIRFLACLLDSIPIALITVPILLEIYGREYLAPTGLIKGPAHFLISYVFPLLFTVVCWLVWRGTPGKLICGLRVVDKSSGEALELWQAIVRYLGYVISLLPLFLGYVWIAFDRNKQGFHDKLANSQVIWKNSIQANR